MYAIFLTLTNTNLQNWCYFFFLPPLLRVCMRLTLASSFTLLHHSERDDDGGPTMYSNWGPFPTLWIFPDELRRFPSRLWTKLRETCRTKKNTTMFHIEKSHSHYAPLTHRRKSPHTTLLPLYPIYRSAVLAVNASHRSVPYYSVTTFKRYP